MTVREYGSGSEVMHSVRPPRLLDVPYGDGPRRPRLSIPGLREIG